MPHNIPDTANGSETLSSFIFSSKFFNASGNIKTGAFRIDKTRNPGRQSVYRCSLLESECIWDLGFKYVAVHNKKPMYCRAIITAQDVYDVEYTLDCDGTPHPLHANIIAELKEVEALECARDLAKKARKDDNPFYQKHKELLEIS